MIEFNRAPFVGSEMKYIQKAIENGKLCGDGPFTKECSRWIKERYHSKEVLLTTSCTHALEMAAFLADIRPGDEVIMPSYTFVSTADAFVLRGAKIVFVDIRPDTMNLDETKIEEAITARTKAVVPVHYAGVGWVGYGSSYLPSDMNAAYLYGQLKEADEINHKRHAIWNCYHENLEELERKGCLTRPFVPDYDVHNAHMYYIKVENESVRSALIQYMKEQGILCVFHYVPLHSSPAGSKFGRFCGEDVYTTRESERLVRLPMFYNLPLDDAWKVTRAIENFFKQR